VQFANGRGYNAESDGEDQSLLGSG